jgi:hypothetical protein
MLLRNLERHREMLDVRNAGQWHRRGLEPKDQTQSNGFFFDHGGATFGLGVSGGEILVLLRDQLVPYGSGLETQIRDEGESRIFVAAYNAAPLVRVTYRPPVPFSTPYYSMEDEDVDGFLWIHNVLSNYERRAIFLNYNGG